MTTDLIKCTCNSEFQDSLYGQNVRVGNKTSSGQFRCTICKTVGGSKTTATAKVPVITETPKEVPKKASAAPAKKKSGGNSGGKDIKKEKPGKKSMKGNKR